MTSLAVASFWVHRPDDYPDAADYLRLLALLEASCRRLDLAHIVLTDNETAPLLRDAGITYFRTDLPRNLMMAFTEAQARWLEFDHRGPIDTLFVGADCLIRREFRHDVPAADLCIAFRPEGKRHRLQNGFMFVPAASRTKVAPLFRRVADTCGGEMCDDLVSIERALSPMPTEYGLQERAGLAVHFLPMSPWNDAPDGLEDSIEDAFVLHFRGRRRKELMVEWALRWMPGAR